MTAARVEPEMAVEIEALRSLGLVTTPGAVEDALAKFKNMEASLVYQTGFAANAGLIPQLAGKGDMIISDELNHASIIDGIRLCKAERFRYANSDMGELEEILKQTQANRRRLIATDGVFSMDGYLAKLRDIRTLADRYDALIMVDDCHATGFIGPKASVFSPR